MCICKEAIMIKSHKAGNSTVCSHPSGNRQTWARTCFWLVLALDGLIDVCTILFFFFPAFLSIFVIAQMLNTSPPSNSMPTALLPTQCHCHFSFLESSPQKNETQRFNEDMAIVRNFYFKHTPHT